MALFTRAEKIDSITLEHVLLVKIIKNYWYEKRVLYIVFGFLTKDLRVFLWESLNQIVLIILI
jgi:hypothetical protein